MGSEGEPKRAESVSGRKRQINAINLLHGRAMRSFRTATCQLGGQVDYSDLLGRAAAKEMKVIAGIEALRLSDGELMHPIATYYLSAVRIMTVDPILAAFYSSDVRILVEKGLARIKSGTEENKMELRAEFNEALTKLRK